MKGYVYFFYQLFLHFAVLPLYCPLSSPGAHTLLRISSMPPLHELGKLTVDCVASQWEEVAPHLVVESCGVCKFGSGHLQEASRGALSRWLKGEFDADIAEKTRCFVLEAQEISGNIPLAEQQMLFEESSGEPVTSLASLLGMCVWGGQNVCTLFAISIPCTLVNTCQWLFLHFHVQVYSELYCCLRITTCVQIFSRGTMYMVIVRVCLRARACVCAHVVTLPDLTIRCS